MEQIYDSRHSGQEVDNAVDAVQTTIPNQLTQIGLNLDQLEEEVGTMPSTSNADETDLNIADDDGNVIAQFANGDFRVKNFDTSKAPQNGNDNAGYDFTISDGEHIIAGFRNGHIVTKNFDSSSLAGASYISKKFKGKKIAIVGDSISTYSGWLPSDVAGFSGTAYQTYYPTGDVTDVSKTWWHKVAVNLGLTPNTDIANTSWSGGTICGDSTSTTYGKPACSSKRIDDVDIRGFVPDIIIVFISCNDWYQGKVIGSWQISDAIPSEGTISEMRSAYALMLHKMQSAYPTARIFCCTILDDLARDTAAGWPSENINGVTTTQWNNNIKEIAEAFGCDVIDVHNCGINYSNISMYAVDSGLHPNAAGMQLIARKVTSELIAKY